MIDVECIEAKGARSSVWPSFVNRRGCLSNQYDEGVVGDENHYFVCRVERNSPMPKVLRRDDAIQLRMTNFVSRHSMEHRLEAYTFGCGRLARKATTDAPFNPLGEITS